MIAYVDSSVILRLVFAQPPFYQDLDRFMVVYTSELLSIECRRTIENARLVHLLSDENFAIRMEGFLKYLQKITEIPLQPTILQRAASPFSTVVKTLDALHLATALSLNQMPMTFITHDEQQGIAARVCGFKVEGLDITNLA